MTPTEVLEEIRKMPPAEKRELLRELSGDIAEPELNGYSEKEKKFIASMKRKGIISQVPLGLPDPGWRRGFKPITVTGEPMSETIIRERR